MIAIYLRPDCTQAVKGRMKKGVLNIQEGVTLDESFLPNISQGGGMSEEAVGLLCDMFEKVHVSLKGKRDEFYVVLPDYVFSMVDCLQSLKKSIRKAARMSTSLQTSLLS